MFNHFQLNEVCRYVEIKSKEVRELLTHDFTLGFYSEIVLCVLKRWH